MKANIRNMYKMASDALRKGNAESVIKKMKRDRLSVSDIAAAFGMSEHAVRRILNSRG